MMGDKEFSHYDLYILSIPIQKVRKIVQLICTILRYPLILSLFKYPLTLDYEILLSSKNRCFLVLDERIERTIKVFGAMRSQFKL